MTWYTVYYHSLTEKHVTITALKTNNRSAAFDCARKLSKKHSTKVTVSAEKGMKMYFHTFDKGERL